MVRFYKIAVIAVLVSHTVGCENLDPGCNQDRPETCEADNRPYANDTAGIAMDAGGNAIASWERYTTKTDHFITSSVYSPGAGWGQSTDFTSVYGWPPPHVIMSEGGLAAISWCEYNTVYVRNYAPTSGWSEKISIYTYPARSQCNSGIVIDGVGRAIVLGYDEQETSQDSQGGVWMARYFPDSGWSELEFMTDPAAKNIENFWLTMNGAGQAVLAWNQPATNDDSPDHWISRYTPENGWGNAQASECSRFSKIALDFAGNMMCVGRDNYELWANRLTPDGVWNTTKLIGDLDGSFNFTMGSGGNAFIFWTQFRNGRKHGLWAIQYSPDNGWGTVDEIRSDDNPGDFKIKADANGNAIAVWSEPYKGKSTMFADRFVAGSGWQPSQAVIAYDQAAILGLDLAMNNNGESIVIWTKIEIGNGSKEEVKSSSVHSLSYSMTSEWGNELLITE